MLDCRPQFARITRTTAMPGLTFLMLMPDLAHTAGVKMVSQGSVITTNASVLELAFGTVRILFSKNASLV